MAAQLEADAVDARVVKALGHPTRVRILNILRERELASPVELSHELEIALGTVGYHVRRLETLGFIELATRTQRRGAVEHHYRARDVLDEPDPVAPGAAGGGLGEEAVGLAAAAQAALARGGFDAVAARADRRILLLDARAQAALRRDLSRWQAAIERIAGASSARLARARRRGAGHRCVAALMRFDVPDDAA